MVTITISGADKSGALARISTFLVRKGYPLKGQQIVESASGGKLVKVSLEVSHLDRAKLTADLSSLSPDFKVLSVEGAESAAPSIREMADRFPDIAPLVRAYGESFGSESRDRELVEAGKKIGAFQYEKEWSFGSPLRMPVALRRTLVPALETLGKVDASDTDVTLSDSPFCGTGKIASCEFLTGFMQGFLDAGPLTQNTRVHKAECRAKGGSRCTYTFSYDL
jgi:predicted hydrocarbon binding protein/predicted amino acid-binding ACT domain protein